MNSRGAFKPSLETLKSDETEEGFTDRGEDCIQSRQGDDRNVNAEKIKFTKLYINTHRKEVIHVK